MKKLVIFGTDAFARLCHHHFTHGSDYTVAGFTVDGAYVKEPTFCGLPVVPFEDVESRFPPDSCHMFVAAGIREINAFRARKVDEAEGKQYTLATYVSARAAIPPDLTLRPNTMIMEFALVQPFVELGRNVIIWPRTAIGLYTRIRDHCWAVCSLFGESGDVGERSIIGVGATIAPFIKIGKRNIIGAGALIMKDTKDDEVYRAVATRPSSVPSSRLKLD